MIAAEILINFNSKLLTKLRVAIIMLDHKMNATGLMYLVKDAALTASYGENTNTYAINVSIITPTENSVVNKNKE
jgi:hypothetical protein